MRNALLILPLLFAFAAPSCSNSRWSEKGTENANRQTVASPNSDSPSATAIAFEECSTGRLSIEIARGSDASKTDVFSAMKVFTEFPAFSLHPQATTDADSISFVAALSASCADSACAESAGWNELQSRLAGMSGVELTCHEGPFTQSPGTCEDDSDPDSPKQDDSKQDSPKQDGPQQDSPDHGGGTGGTGGE